MARADLSYDVNNLDPYDNYPCCGCGKDVYPPDRLICLKAVWHKTNCLKCTECGTSLNTRTVQSFQNKPYCKPHLPKMISTTQGLTTATSTKGATTAKGKIAAKNTAKNWDVKKEMEDAKAQNYVVPEEKKAVHVSQLGRDPQAEIQAARAKGYKAPAAKLGAHASQQRRDPQAEVAAARAAAPSGWDEEKSTPHPSTKSWSPAEEIAAARAQSSSGWDHEEPVRAVAKKEPIRGGNVAAFAGKFAKAAAEPEAPPKPAPKKAPGKLAAKFSAPPAREPEPEPEPEPAWGEEEAAEEAWGGEEEAAPAEEAWGEEEAAPAEEAWAEEEAPAEEAWGEEEAGGYQYATALYDYAGDQEGDLAFNAGDVITITDTSDPDGWWQGELNGVTGQFPSNFVEITQ